MDFIYLFLIITGYIIGLGAVTVIDLHGFLGRHSSYWTEATTRTHKITKPLIWIGTLLVLGAGLLWYDSLGASYTMVLHGVVFFALVVNGIFLSFGVSPFLLQREREGRQSELLPRSWQRNITISFIISFVGWWGSLALFVSTIVGN